MSTSLLIVHVVNSSITRETRTMQYEVLVHKKCDIKPIGVLEVKARNIKELDV